MSRSLALAREAKDKVDTMIALINLGEVAHYRRDLPLAVARYLEGFPLLLEIGDKVSITATLEMFAFLVIDLGNVEAGLCLLGAAEAQREILNSPIIPRERKRHDEFIAIAREQISEEVFQSAWATGRKLSPTMQWHSRSIGFKQMLRSGGETRRQRSRMHVAPRYSSGVRSG
jgi:hypothetical protein